MSENLISSAVAGAPFGLQVEYRTNPVGIDEPNPRFAWRCPAGIISQSAYEIIAE